MATLATFSPKPREPVPSKLIVDKDSSPKVRVPCKGIPTVSIDVQSRTPSCLYSIASVSQRLRAAMQVFHYNDRSPLPSGQVPEPDEDQGQWTPLPTSLALVPRTLTAPSIYSRTGINNHHGPSMNMSSSVHTVSRAPSFASLDTASVSSSEGPATPHNHSPSLHEPISPTLSYLEHTSRIRVPGVCVTCKRAGANFPSCPTCGDVWCSRECRLVSTGGKKHHCLEQTGGLEPESSGSDELHIPLEAIA